MLLSSILSFTLAAAAPAPTPPALTTFDSPEEAAVHILELAYQHLPYFEVGGVITRVSPGKYAIGKPHTDYSGHSVEIEEDPDAYQGVIVATYHTHPCLDHTHIPGEFSDEDMKSTRITGHEGFMADLCTGEVHAAKPGIDTEAKGRIVGKFPVVYKRLED